MVQLISRKSTLVVSNLFPGINFFRDFYFHAYFPGNLIINNIIDILRKK